MEKSGLKTKREMDGNSFIDQYIDNFSSPHLALLSQNLRSLFYIESEKAVNSQTEPGTFAGALQQNVEIEVTVHNETEPARRGIPCSGFKNTKRGHAAGHAPSHRMLYIPVPHLLLLRA